MNITDFTENQIEEAISIVKANYEEERHFVPVLPAFNNFPDLSHFAENGLGASIFENGKMLGFLCCYAPWDNAFGTTYVKGTFSPVEAHSAVYNGRELIYKFLYQAAAEKWIKKGIASHAVGFFAHDTQTKNSFFQNGFGLRCIDAVRPMDEIDYLSLSGYDFCELPYDDKAVILPLKNMLIAHLAKSPAVMFYPEMNEDDLQKQSGRRKNRLFTAGKSDEIIAFIEVTDSGENFVCDDSGMMNICGAYCLPEHRGKGVYQNLLNFLITVLRDEGYTRLGVDFESFNPTAYGFWLKYFTAYTNSVVRRIDERIFANEI
jgi:hypothetical protein